MDTAWWAVSLAGLVVGFVVGLTGMGGGALMTPIMILFFGVEPLAAVSSDLVASLVMKPVGGAVHMRRGTVNRGLVTWLVIGSVPSAFLGVFVLRWLGGDENTQTLVKLFLGIALSCAAAAMVAKALLDLRKRRNALAAGVPAGSPLASIQVKPVPTLIVGVLGGLIVGMTSVGSGSLMIVSLLLIYPGIRAGELVGTDLVQAVPLVASASLGHLLYGDFKLGLTASLLVGALPGVYAGARISSVAPSGVIRRALVIVLLASALKLLEATTTVLVVVLVSVMALGPLLWAAVFRVTGPEEDKRPWKDLLLTGAAGRWLSWGGHTRLDAPLGSGHGDDVVH